MRHLDPPVAAGCQRAHHQLTYQWRIRERQRVAAALKDSSPDVRILAAQILSGIGESESPVDVLIGELSHPSRLIRFDALWALVKIGKPARRALPHLEKALTPSAHLEVLSRDNLESLVDWDVHFPDGPNVRLVEFPTIAATSRRQSVGR